MARHFVMQNGRNVQGVLFYGVPQVGQIFSSLGRMYEIVEVRPSIDMLIVQEI